MARLLIRLGNSGHSLTAVENQRSNNRRCGIRPRGTGGAAVGPPNSRSKNEGPEENEGPDENVLSLAKLTPAGRLPFGRL